jgi:2-oxoglutarate ferredoxin oxidoreductase subunit alpha
MDVTFKVAGEAGQGLQTIGEILAHAFARAGRHLFAHQDYMSRVRGGHNFFQVRVADVPVCASRRDVNVLVALSDQAIVEHRSEVVEGGAIIYDGERRKVTCSGRECFSVPLQRLAEEVGSRVMMNSVAVGAVWGLFRADFRFLEEELSDHFRDKGADVISANTKAGRAGYEFALKNYQGACCYPFEPLTGRRLVLKGNEALALGALAAGCRFMSAYPMTPSTSITEFIAAEAERFNLVMEQAEDEIAAINLALGAAFAGVRSLVATSGGGFCLMVEALGLAGATETPIVIINGQRPGPSTGLPTRTAQGDLLFVLHASQGDFPRVVLAPGDAEEAFYLAAKAFNIAERYQLPVILLSDQHLADSYVTLEPFDLSRVTIDRGLILSAEEGDRLGGNYKRHLLTDSGVSPRAFPGLGRALVVTAGDEHDEGGHLIEDGATRNQQMDKRMRKLEVLRPEMAGPKTFGDASAAVALFSWGSTLGAVREAVELLNARGQPVRGVHLSELWPFPREKVSEAFTGAKQVVGVEANYAGQGARLLRMETGVACTGSIRKYDGRCFTPDEIVEGLGKAVR